MADIAFSILIVGLAAVSAWAVVMSDGEYGEGWGLLAVVLLVLAILGKTLK